MKSSLAAGLLACAAAIAAAEDAPLPDLLDHAVGEARDGKPEAAGAALEDTLHKIMSRTPGEIIQDSIREYSSAGRAGLLPDIASVGADRAGTAASPAETTPSASASGFADPRRGGSADPTLRFTYDSVRMDVLRPAPWLAVGGGYAERGAYEGTRPVQPTLRQFFVGVTLEGHKPDDPQYDIPLGGPSWFRRLSSWMERAIKTESAEVPPPPRAFPPAPRSSASPSSAPER